MCTGYGINAALKLATKNLYNLSRM